VVEAADWARDIAGHRRRQLVAGKAGRPPDEINQRPAFLGDIGRRTDRQHTVVDEGVCRRGREKHHCRCQDQTESRASTVAHNDLLAARTLPVAHETKEPARLLRHGPIWPNAWVSPWHQEKRAEAPRPCAAPE